MPSTITAALTFQVGTKRYRATIDLETDFPLVDPVDRRQFVERLVDRLQTVVTHRRERKVRGRLKADFLNYPLRVTSVSGRLPAHERRRRQSPAEQRLARYLATGIPRHYARLIIKVCTAWQRAFPEVSWEQSHVSPWASGRCFDSGRIHITASQDDAETTAVVLHELAHAFNAFGKGHDDAFYVILYRLASQFWSVTRMRRFEEQRLPRAAKTHYRIYRRWLAAQQKLKQGVA